MDQREEASSKAVHVHCHHDSGHIHHSVESHCGHGGGFGIYEEETVWIHVR